MGNTILSEFKNTWSRTSIFTLLIAGSFSLTFFVRLLDFFITPNLNKPFIFLFLFIYFLCLVTIFVGPIWRFLLSHLRVMALAGLVSILVITALFIFLPFQYVPFPTTHQLTVSVPEGGNEIVLEGLAGPDGTAIPIDTIIPGQAVIDDDVYIRPGEPLVFSRDITGGVSFKVTALSGPATVFVRWDEQEKTIPLNTGQTESVATDPYSPGSPSQAMRLINLALVVNEWITGVLLLTLILTVVYAKVSHGPQPHYTETIPLLRCLADYLVFDTLLILLATKNFYFPLGDQAFNAIALTAGFICFVAKLIGPLIKLSPLVLAGFVYVLCVNFLLNTKYQDFSTLRMIVLDSGSLNEFVLKVNPSQPTQLSLGFYEQLREATLILPPDSYLAQQDNLDRLITLNRLENVSIQTYPDKLSASQAAAWASLNSWDEWDGPVYHYYFCNQETSEPSPIAWFSSEETIFLVPIHALEDLGFDYVFVLD